MGNKEEASFKATSKSEIYLIFTNSKDKKKEILVNLVCVNNPISNVVVLPPSGLTDDLINPVSNI